MLVVVRLQIDRLAKLAHALAERPSQFRQALGAEHHQGDHTEEQQVDRTLDSHCSQASAPTSRARPLAAEAARTLLRVAQETSSQLGRPYPPPPTSEPFWPAQATIIAAIGLQVSLPERLTVGPSWLVPAFEGLLLAGMIIVTPNEAEEEHPRRRRVALVLTALVGAANIYSLGALTHFLLHHHPPGGRELIIAGTLIWLTNFLIFGLWYWQMDRGGPGKRATGKDGAPDFLFPQMSDDRIEPQRWRPKFIDYMYVSLTNATAFSPTDAMPLSQVAKITMGVQALVSLVTIGLIVSRAVNILA